jgi:predicted nucleic acid-binding protein
MLLACRDGDETDNRESVNYTALVLVHLTGQVARRAATLMQEYRRSHSGIGLGDYLIAVTALTEGLEIATLNIRRYPMFPDLARPF